MDIPVFLRKAQRNKGPLTAFLKKLDTLVPEDMPRVVAEEDQKVWIHIDCTSCAHCCKTMTPTFNAADLKRIAAHIGMTPKAMKEKWLKKDEYGDWVNRDTPCQFLQPDNRCGIYEVRPKDCAEFPHHNKKPFDAYNQTFINNIIHCPATYELVTRLKKRVEAEYEW